MEPTRFEGGYLIHTGYRVRAWPPYVEPENPKGFSILAMVLAADPDSPFWPLAQLVPKAARDSGCGWRAAYIWHANPEQADRMFARCPAALVLFSFECQASPAWLTQQATEGFSTGETGILRVVGYPSDRAFFRVLSRLTRRCHQKENFRVLRKAWRVRKIRKMLPHLKRLNGDVIQLLKLTPDRISWRLLQAAQMTHEEGRDISWAVSMLASEWLLTLRHLHGGLPPPPTDWPYGNLDPEHIHSAIYRLHMKRSMAPQFPPQPYPRTDTIIPITTARQLHAESRAQRNCSIHFQSQIANGELYFYSLRRFYCRCTVVLKCMGDRWVLSELKGWSNSPPSIQALQEVLQWLCSIQPHLSEQEIDQRPSKDFEGWWDEECQ